MPNALTATTDGVQNIKVTRDILKLEKNWWPRSRKDLNVTVEKFGEAKIVQ